MLKLGVERYDLRFKYPGGDLEECVIFGKSQMDSDWFKFYF